MNDQIEIEFNDIALIIDPAGFECGSITGHAVVAFTSTVDWELVEISLTGSRRAMDDEVKRSGVWVSKEVVVTADDHGFLYFTIKDQIEALKKSEIEDRIIEAIAEAREPRGSTVDLREYAL